MVRDAAIVGINNYQGDNLRNLTSPAEDAEAIAQILEKYGEFDVVRRFPEAIKQDTRKPYVAKKQNFNKTDLEDALVDLFKPESKQIPDTALFYFSGHGIRKTKGIQEGFLCTSDVRPDLGFNGLSLQWLRRLLQESPIRQQIIILDCCNSGELLNFKEADPGEQGQARDRCFIAASREFEQSFEDLNSSYSVLTKVLLEGLDPNRCPQQWITNYSLIEFINQNLRHENQRPIFNNFGSPINLTLIRDTSILSKSESQDNQNIRIDIEDFARRSQLLQLSPSKLQLTINALYSLPIIIHKNKILKQKKIENFLLKEYKTILKEELYFEKKKIAFKRFEAIKELLRYLRFKDDEIYIWQEKLKESELSNLEEEKIETIIISLAKNDFLQECIEKNFSSEELKLQPLDMRKMQELLAEDINLEKPTIRNFFSCEPIKYGLFVSICLKLKLKWQEIQDIDFLKIIVQTVPQIRFKNYAAIQNQCGTLRILDITRPIELDDLYVDVNILDEPISYKR